MTGGRLFLLRHGETTWSRDGRHTGITDVPLTARGHKRAVAAGGLGVRLRGGADPALVLCSPRTRARQTAEAAGLRVDAIDARLHEWDYGAYEGLTTLQIRENVPDWTIWTHPCPDGEDAAAVGARADDVLATVRNELPRGDVVLVGHGHFTRALIARWVELSASDGVRFAADSASWAVLGDERGVPRADHINLRAAGRDYDVP